MEGVCLRDNAMYGSAFVCFSSQVREMGEGIAGDHGSSGTAAVTSCQRIRAGMARLAGISSAGRRLRVCIFAV
jgi:hypothetical protein